MLGLQVAPVTSRHRQQVLDLRTGHLAELLALATPFILIAPSASIATDTWWVLKMGQLTLSAGRPVDTVLAHAPALPGAANGQWLAQVVLYLLYQAGGETGLILLAGLLASASFGLVVAAAWVAGGSPRAAAFAVLVTAVLAASSLAVRAQLFSYLLFGLTYLLIQLRFRHPRLLYVLPALFALWVNLHGAFVLGLLLIAIHAVGDALSAAASGADRRARLRSNATRCVVVLGASLMATWLNPLGPAVYAYVGIAVAHPSVGALVDEFRATTIRDPDGLALAASGLLLLVATRASRRPILATEVLLLLAFGYLAMASMRYIVWWGMVLAPILARHAADATFPDWLSRKLSSTPEISGARTARNLVAASLLMALALASPMWRPAFAEPLRGPKASVVHSPARAADFVSTLPSGSRLYNFQPWTGYLAWRLWPGQLPLVDGRVEAHPPEVWADYLAVSTGLADWEVILARYRVDHLVLHSTFQRRLADLAQASGRWTKLYEDGTAVVLTRHF